MAALAHSYAGLPVLSITHSLPSAAVAVRRQSYLLALYSSVRRKRLVRAPILCLSDYVQTHSLLVTWTVTTVQSDAVRRADLAN